MPDIETLRADLRLIDEVFPDLAGSSVVEKSDIADYYDRSFLGYSVFHSRDGAVHLALTPGAGAAREDFEVQAKEVSDFIRETAASRVLEVGCGRGFNLAYLAQTHPDQQFFGVDYSPSHVKAAKKRLKRLGNVQMSFGDFHGLPGFTDAQADLIYAVETLCHAQDPSAVLAEMCRILPQGGLLIVYDGFRDRIDGLGDEMMTAIRYTERAMAVPQFAEIRDFERRAREVGFEVLENTDRTDDALPNARRLERLARRFFKRPYLPSTRIPLAPRKLLQNAVAGLLMPTVMEGRALSYRRTVFRKI